MNNIVLHKEEPYLTLEEQIQREEYKYCYLYSSKKGNYMFLFSNVRLCDEMPKGIVSINEFQFIYIFENED